MPSSTDPNVVDYYEAEVVSAQDYYPFGMAMPGRQFNAGVGYKYGFNGQEKSTEIDPNGNSLTAEFWQYDSRIGRRWNQDPRLDVSISPYNCFAGNPILFSDPFGDTSKIYGVAEVTNTTLLDKGGVNERAGQSILYKDARINPVYAKDNKTLVGYNVYDRTSDRQDPIYQLENEADLASFKKNYKWEFGGAQQFYANGEPSIGMKQIVASYDGGKFNSGLYLKGLKKEWKDALNDPLFVTQLLLSVAHAGVSAADRAPNITYPTKSGNYPSWTTVKARYWDIMNKGNVPKGTALVRVRATGVIKQVEVSKELHHLNGRAGPDPHNFSNLKEVWPWEHEAIDPLRNTGYDFVRWVNK